ncbi:putative tubulin polyglutamylase ttll9 [Globomyces sp. JEL0801]|nr:putative tubulin polyglutamylase ttll9 [Globomyces sp. JEL0801]
MKLELLGRSYSGVKNQNETIQTSTNENTNELESTRNQLNTLLTQALETGTLQPYSEALLLEQYRDALLEQKLELTKNVQQDLQRQTRQLAPRTYGWTGCSEMFGFDSKMQKPMTDLNDMQRLWKQLRNLEAHTYQLEDSNVCNEFFEELKDLMVEEDLKPLDPEVIKTHYPWLAHQPKAKKANLFNHYLLNKQKKKPVIRIPRVDENKKTISKQRLEKDLQEKEKEIRECLNTKFHATPIPASSIIPKYDAIIGNQRTKASDIRQKAIANKILKESKSQKTTTNLKNKENNSEEGNIDPILLEALEQTNKKSKIAQGFKRIEKLLETEDQRRKKLLESQKQSGLTEHHTFKPKISKSPPNFQRLHEKMTRNIDEKKSKWSPTIFQPFEGLTKNHTAQSQKSVQKEAVEITRQVKSTKANYEIHKQAIEPKSTLSFKLKVEHRKIKQEADELIHQICEEEQRIAEERRKELSKKIRLKIDSNSSILNRINREKKLKRNSEENIRMKKEYEQKIQEMNDRLSTRMCLFEECRINSIKNKTKHDVDNILLESGLKPEHSTTLSTPTIAASVTPVLNQTIRFKTGLRNTVWDCMRDRGWKETDSDLDWDFFWADVHWIHETFDHVYLQEQQRINHFRNHYELTRKDLLVKNVKRMIKTVEKEYGKQESQKFEFITTSYVLPQEHALFQEEFKRTPGGIWIMKPVGKAQGKGIFLINKLSQISGWKKDPRLKGKNDDESTPEAYIVQRYIENPYLIGGKKFDIRTYVLVTSYYPLVVYIHRNGFCRFSNSQFSMNVKDISNLYIHATNVAIQKHSPNYDGDKGCKWLLRNLKTFLVTKHGSQKVDELFTEMEALVVRSLMSVQKVMINDKHCFELYLICFNMYRYGYDILIDDNLKPWLLEVNASPSLSAETQFDYDLKYAMINDAFNVVDLEKKHSGDKSKLRQKVGGFDLVYNDGPVKHERTRCYQPIPRAPRVKKRFAVRAAAAAAAAAAASMNNLVNNSNT